MKLQNGSVYMASIRDFSNPIMGVVVMRMWWKPWRWSVTPIYWAQPPGTLAVRGIFHATPITNLSKEGAIGVAKLHGVKHKDFEDNMYMRME